MSWVEMELAEVDLGDARLDRRLIRVVDALTDKPEQSVPRACGSAAATKAVYRFWDNERVTDSAIRAAHTLATCSRCLDYEVVLAIQDTTSFDFTRHPATHGLGYLDAPYLHGLKVHSTFAASEQGVPLGLLHQQVWVRDDAELGKRKRRHGLATADKESQRWLDALEATQQALSAIPCVITIADCEADFFDLLAAKRQSNHHWLIRATHDRRLDGETDKLFAALAAAPTSSVKTVPLPKAKLDAVLTLRHREATICPPENALHAGQEPMAVHAILAQEDNAPPDVEPILWRLLTTLPVENDEDVRRCLRLYAQRWLIERYHFTLKSGCGIEKLQLETAERLQRALATYCIVAWRLLWLTYLARKDDRAPCTVAFKEYEWQSLCCTIHQTLTLPAQPPTLRQAVRWIAQLGGFLARKGDGEPGVKVLWRGLQRLVDISDTWQLLHAHAPGHDYGLVGKG